MAGGITLLAAMLLLMPPLVAIPLHGAIQLASNGSRALIQRRHARFDIVWRSAVLLLPMGWVGIQVAQELPESAIRIAIGVFVLFATWAPQLLLLGTHPEEANSNRRFILLSGATGFLNVTIGATGPLIAPFFLNLGLTRQALVGTKAACQALGHLAKILIYGGVGFAFQDHLPLLAGGIAAAVVGTWTGSRMLEHVSERAFVILYKTVLTLISVRLVLAELL
jgi:uncharacterized membrane protein YfcA